MALEVRQNWYFDQFHNSIIWSFANCSACVSFSHQSKLSGWQKIKLTKYDTWSNSKCNSGGILGFQKKQRLIVMDPIAKHCKLKSRTSAFLFVVRSYDQKCEKDKLELLACTKNVLRPIFQLTKSSKIVHLRSIPENEYLSIFLVF